MGILEWATSPWGQHVPIHIAWVLIWVCLFAGIGFMVVHAIYIAVLGKPKLFVRNDSPEVVAQVPEKVRRHGLVARMFHWIMALSMFTLLFTAFLPKVGVRFDWVTWHWIAGTVFTASVIFHIVHASFFLDFWSIWPDRIDVRDTIRRMTRFMGKPAPLPDRFGKYPLENKMYHFVIMVTGVAAILTGSFMMKRVTTVFFTRNPYIFSDMTWGLMYVLHGFVGVSLIALVLVHVYFGLRPEKREITRSMILGWMGRDFYLEEHDPLRWNPKHNPDRPAGFTGPATDQ
jgi:formate dehydrogenase gamma subunit